MVYIYYMKIKSFLFSFLLLFPVLAWTQVTVVRVENNTVYLDTSSLQVPVHKGDTFKVIISAEKLTNPKTGKDLGPLYKYSPEGKITEVQPLYAVGVLPQGKAVFAGQEAVLEVAAASTTAPDTAATPKPLASKHKTFTYVPVPQEIISLSSAAVTAPGDDNIITLSSKGKVTVWKKNGEELSEETSYQLPKNKTPLTLSAAAVRGKDNAEIFATVYDNYASRITTFVLSYENGKWNELATLPYFVKEMGCAPHKTIWMQKPFVTESRPGNAYNLVYENKRFQPGKQTLRTQHNWLSGLTNAAVEKTGADNFLYTTATGKIKMQLANGKNAESKNLFASSPNRVKYKQEILKFYPSLQVVHSQDKAEIAGVENVSKHGLLSATFGMYQNGKIHFLSFEKGRLDVTDTVELDGYVYDTACAANAVLTAEVLPNGESSVVEIFY